MIKQLASPTKTAEIKTKGLSNDSLTGRLSSRSGSFSSVLTSTSSLESGAEVKPNLVASDVLSPELRTEEGFSALGAGRWNDDCGRWYGD